MLTAHHGLAGALLQVPQQQVVVRERDDSLPVSRGLPRDTVTGEVSGVVNTDADDPKPVAKSFPVLHEAVFTTALLGHPALALSPLLGTDRLCPSPRPPERQAAIGVTRLEEVVMGGTLTAGVTPEMRGSSPPAQALPAAERTGSGCRRPPWARHAGMLTASLQRPELRGECCCRSGPGLRCGYGSPAGWTLAAGASSLPGRRADRCRPGAMKGPAGAGPSGGTDVDPGPGGHAPRSSHLTNRYARGAGGREAEPRAERGSVALTSPAETPTAASGRFLHSSQLKPAPDYPQLQPPCLARCACERLSKTRTRTAQDEATGVTAARSAHRREFVFPGDILNVLLKRRVSFHFREHVRRRSRWGRSRHLLRRRAGTPPLTGAPWPRPPAAFPTPSMELSARDHSVTAILSR